MSGGPVPRSVTPLGLALLLFACGEGRLVLIPPAPDDAEALLVVAERPGQLDLYAVDARRGIFEAELGPELPLTLTALAYSDPLERYGLEEGRIFAPAAGQPAAALPPPSELHLATVDASGAASDWTRLEDLPAPLLEARLPTRSAIGCIEAGGCFLERPPSGAPLCITPCPEPEPPLAPRPPEPPRVAELPAAWVRTSSRGVELALPWRPEAPTCPEGQIRTPDAPSCAPLVPCPGERFSPSTPAGASYVDPAAPVGGDGSLERPFRSLAAATARPGIHTIALAAGEHTAPSLPSRDLELIGLCPDEVRVVFGAAQFPSGFRVRLSGLELHGPVLSEGALELEGVRVRGELTTSGLVEGRRVAVDGATRVRGDGRLALADAALRATGLALTVEGEAALQGVSVESTAVGAVYVTSGGTLEGSSLSFAAEEGIAARVDGLLRGRGLLLNGRVRAHGLRVGTGASAQVEGATILGTALYGATVLEGALTLSDAVVFPSRSGTSTLGFGLNVDPDGRAELTRVIVSGASGYGINVDGPRAGLDIDDVHILDTGPTRTAPRREGVSLRVGSGAEAHGSRVLVRGAYKAGVHAAGQNTLLALDDLQIEDVRGRFETGKDGRGLHVFDKAAVELTRVLVRRATAVGVLVEEKRSWLEASHLRIEGTRDAPSCSGTNCNFGRSGALRVEIIGRAQITRFAFEDNGAYGAAIGSSGGLELRRGLVRGQSRGLVVAVQDYPIETLAVRVQVLDAVQSVVELAP